MNHEDDGRYEPTRFAWVYDGLLVAGTLADWAKEWEADYEAYKHYFELSDGYCKSSEGAVSVDLGTYFSGSSRLRSS